MANVAGVSQLMENVGVAPTPSQTPAAPASSSTAQEQSFASAMRQANTDAGVPAAPAERKAQAKPSESSQPAGKPGDAAGLAEGTLSPNGDANQTSAACVVTTVAPTTTRYTSANMLSAMLNRAGAADVPKAVTATQAAKPEIMPPAQVFTPSVATPPPASVVACSTDSGVGTTLLEEPALVGKPVDLAAPLATPYAGPPRLASKGEPSTPARPTVKQDSPLKAAEVTATPVLTVAAAPVPSVMATAMPVPVEAASTPGTTSLIPVDVPPVKSPTGSVASIAKVSPAPQTVAAVSAPEGDVSAQLLAPSASRSSVMDALQIPFTGQNSKAATFKQSLAVETTAAVSTSALDGAIALPPTKGPLQTTGDLLPGVSITPQAPQPTKQLSSQPTQPTPAISSATRQAPLATPAQAAALSVTAAVQPIADAVAQVQSSTLQVTTVQALPLAPAQTSTSHKVTAKPSLAAADAVPVPAAASQATAGPVASVPSADGEPAPHVSAFTAVASAQTLAADPSVSVVTSFPVAHTPVAVTALSNPTGPTLAPTAVTTAASTPTTDLLQHTTLSSTPTTLEVGVASGTHGWLKIRAELNATGTVDASLMGANAAATGKLHNDLSALSSFLQDERVAVGSLNVSAPGAVVSALHASAAATLEATSSFTRSAAEGVGATGTAVASDAGSSGNRAPQQQAPQSSPQVVVTREDDRVSRTVVASIPALYGDTNELGGGGALSQGGYGSGGSWLNVRV